MRKISPEEKEMLIVAENFGCIAEVIAELGITAEEAKEIIWGEDQERGRQTLFLFWGGFFTRPLPARRSRISALYYVSTLSL